METVMTVQELLQLFGDTGTTVGLAVFIIWLMSRREERTEKKMEDRDKQLDSIVDRFTQTVQTQSDRFTSALEKRDERFVQVVNAINDKLSGEIAQVREQLVLLRMSLAKHGVDIVDKDDIAQTSEKRRG